MMKRLILSLGFLLVFGGPSFAAVCGVTALTVKDAAVSPNTVTVPYSDTGDGSGNCQPGVKVLNATAPGQNTAGNSSPVVPPADMAGNVPIANLVFGTTAAMTGTTSTQLLAAVASKILYPMNISCVNSSTTGTFVTVQDGSGGTALGTLTAAPSFGGDEQHNATIPLYKTTAGNGLYVANVTTGANVICTASGWHN